MRRSPEPPSSSTSVASLLLAGERAFAEAAEVDGALHRVLALERTRVDDVEMRALDVDAELDRDLGTFDRARDVGLAQLRGRVVSGELLAVLFQVERG